MKFIEDWILKHEEYIMKTLFSSFMIFVVYFGLIIASKYFGLNFVFFNTIPASNTGVIINQNTGSITPTDSGTVIVDTGSFTRAQYIENLYGTGLTTMDERIGYILSFGEEGLDFVTKKTQKQGMILGKDKSLNNVFLHSFLQKYQYELNIDKTATGFLVVTTEKPVPSDRDMLFALNGVTLGTVHKKADKSAFKSDESENLKDNVYIFPVNNIIIAQQIPPGVDLTKRTENNISIAIGDNYNSVISLSIVYFRSK